MRFKKLISIYLYFMIFVSALSADKIYVNKSAAPGGDGTSWGSAFQFIHDALDTTDLNSGDEVWIAKGTYYPDEGSSREDNAIYPFYLTNVVGIYGGFAGNETSLEQRDLILNKTIINGSFFTNDDLTSVYDNTNPLGTGPGVSQEWEKLYGGSFSSSLFVIGDRITLDGLTIKNTVNYNFGDPGIISTNTTPTSDVSVLIKNCTFLYNYTADTPLFGSLTTQNNNTFYKFDNCKFEYNKGVRGGYVYGGFISGTSVKLTNCVIRNNAFYYMFIHISNLDATNCVFTQNSTLYPFYDNVASETVNCVFYANLAESLFLSINSPLNHSATNCTFSYNDFNILAESQGSGHFFLRNCIIDGSNEIRSTLFSNVNATNSSFEYFSEYNQPTLRSVNIIFGDLLTDFVGFGSGFVITDDPMFVDLSDVDGADNIWGTSDDGLRLQSTSPAIDLVNNNFQPTDTKDLDQDGNTTEALSLDITGNARKQGDAMDLGAYEFNSSEIGSSDDEDDLSDSRLAGQSDVTSDPNSFNLFTAVQVDAAAATARSEGQNDVTSDPGSFSLYSASDLTAAQSSSRTLGQQDVVASPLSFGLYSPSYVVSLLDSNRAAGHSDVIADPTLYGLYSEQGISELITDLRPGSTLINVENGQATLSMEIEQSDDLEIWTSGGTTNLQIPIDANSNTKFFRFKMSE